MTGDMWRANFLVHNVSILPLLQDGDPTHRRISNLIQPFESCQDNMITRGSYAGWITCNALWEASVRNDTETFSSLVDFFRHGGALWDLERRAASVLRPFPHPSGDFPPRLRFIAALSPLGSWRLKRWSRLSGSKDPLRSSKIAELTDWRFWIAGGKAGRPWLGDGGQDTAYLKDPATRQMISKIRRQAEGLVDDARSCARYETTHDRLGRILEGHSFPESCDAPLILGALWALGDPVSCAVAARIGNEYRLDLAPGVEFERRVRKKHALEGRPIFTDPATQDAVYFGPSRHGRPTLYARTLPLNIPWNLDAEDVFFEVLARIVHEDRHHSDLRALKYGGSPEEDFAFELRAHGTEFLWRSLQGDTQDLRRFSFHHPLGLGLGFRDYYEAYYCATT